ncbi:MAG: zinc-binding dehydrogenase [Deltaproteobacteria bacterium]|nr:MAG: zinc-binding dehydrogenase [Deltaproteobacteria bacterium]
MRAAVYYQTGAPDVFRYEEVPDPACAPDGVLVDVQAISVEGGDVLHRARGEMPSRPHIVGYQCAGVIREVGAQVRNREPGQRVVAVMMHGSHAERVATAANATWLVPDGLDLPRASAVPIAVGTADDCLFEFGRLAAGESVLIQAGAGGVGMAAIQLAKRAGATVLATASSDAKLDRLKQFGLDHGINYRTTDFATATREITNGRGVDLVVDSIGGRTLERSFEAATYRGRIISVGSAGRDDVRPDVSLLRPGNKSLTGVFFGAELAIHHDRVHAMVERHLEDLRAGRLEVIVDRCFPLARAAEAHAYIESRQAFGRVLLVP